MTNIDDSTQTPPGYWFGVIDSRLHERMREALADQGLRRGGWRILHTLAEGPASAAELGERLPHGGRGRDRHHDRGHDGHRVGGNERTERTERAESHEHGWHHDGCDRHAHRAGYGYGYGGYGYGDPRREYASDGHGHAHGHHPGWRGQEPRDERPAGPGHPMGAERPGPESEHEHDHDHGHDHDHEHERHDHAAQHGAEHPHQHPHPHQHDDHAAQHGAEHAFERGYEHGFDRGYTFGAARAGHAFSGPFPPAPFGPFHGGHPAAWPFAGSGGPFPGHFPGGFGRPFPGGGAPFGRYGHDAWNPFDGDPRRFRGGHHGGRGYRAHHGDRRIHRIERILAEFVERGWVWFDGDRATLTDEGRAAHDTAFERVSAVRAELADGIAEGDYATTMATLEAMARNLGWRPEQSDASPDPAPDAAPDAPDGRPEPPAEGEPKMEA